MSSNAGMRHIHLLHLAVMSILIASSISAALIRSYSSKPSRDVSSSTPTHRPSRVSGNPATTPRTQAASSILRTLAVRVGERLWRPSRFTSSKVVEALEGGWAPRTRRGHSSSVRRYLNFCHAERVPQDLRLPAVEQVVCAFAASRTGVISGSTARNDLAGLRAWHVRHNQPWPESRRLRIILEGVERLRPCSSIRDERVPVTLDMIRSLVASLSTSNTFDAAVRTCALLAFWGQCRLGELLPESKSSFSAEYHPSQADWYDGQVVSLRLPWTKTTKSKGASVPLLMQSSRTCPVTALRAFASTSSASPANHLFAYRTKLGHQQPLSKRAFLARVNAIWAAEGT
jgi:hypothetical protein